MTRFLPLLLAAACGSAPDPGDQRHRPLSADWVGFPAERDLAILLPLDPTPLFPADTPMVGGQELLPGEWLKAVSRAYQDTEVGDALESESMPEDWRLVSIRVSPCAPIGRSPAQAPASLCWPIVRLVWQPVVTHMQLGGVNLPAYADDRAIHALYPVAPRDEAGARVSAGAHDSVKDHISRGELSGTIPTSTRAAYDAERDLTTAWLLSELEQLRSDMLASDSWSDIDLRPELYASDEVAGMFQSSLHDFLNDFAPEQDLRELTSFSLPAGRNPSGDDIWVFLQFLSDGQTLSRNSLEVFSRTDGMLLLDYGMEQSVGQINESDAVSAALSDGSSELHDTVVESTADIELVADLIADPEAVFVPNTTCATCHRLNDLRFDFHSLSHLEDREHTISPRVFEDVARDLTWVQEWLGAVQPLAPVDSEEDPQGGDDAQEDSDSEGTSPAADAEPNDTAASAVTVSLPMSLDGEITVEDVDYFRFTTSGGTASIQLQFQHAQGDLDLSLYSEDGELLATSASVSDEEFIQAELDAGRYLALVYGYWDATGAYALQISE